jgi:plasmid maintenance system antidote protein VapI
MALRKAFGVRMDTLMRMQNAFDIAETRKRAGKIKVKRYSSMRGPREAAKGPPSQRTLRGFAASREP